MRNLVIERISELMREYPDLMIELDLAPDELENLSNVDLVDILMECMEIIHCG
jgi:DNA-binding transcriptional LysR family regulator